jgi:hypothetical protein
MDELSVIFTDCKRSRAFVEAFAAILVIGDRAAAGSVFPTSWQKGIWEKQLLIA